jgi:hypothetical protein
MGEGTVGVDRLPSPPERGVGGEGVQLLSVNQGFQWGVASMKNELAAFTFGKNTQSKGQ